MPRFASPLLLVLAFVFLLVAVLLRTAWVSDDAFITFRTVDNALNGHGLRWNVAERVQSYTHPLWMLLLLPAVAVTGNPYVASLLLSFALTAITLALFVLPIRHRPWAVATGLAVLLFSKAFVDYSTGGLENPLSHALLAALMVASAPRNARRASASATPARPHDRTTAPPHDQRQRPPHDRIAAPASVRAATLALLVALIGLSRLDLLLLALPIALAGLLLPSSFTIPFSIQHPAFSIGRAPSLALGATPLALWTLFSIVYYGVPFPNTAYAKLSTGVPQEMLTRQGFRYLGESLERDPLTLPVIAAAVLAPIVVSIWRVASGGSGLTGRTGRTGRAGRTEVRPYGWWRPYVWWRRSGARKAELQFGHTILPVSLGLLLYIVYVIRIGGDFMSGRFFAAPLVVAVFLLHRIGRPPAAAESLAPSGPDARGTRWRALTGLAGVLLAAGIGLSAREPSVALLLGPSTLTFEEIWTPHGVVDERSFYADRTAFMIPDGFRTEPRQDLLRPIVEDLRAQHPRTIVYQTVGMAGYYVGPDRHVIDTLALCDPLLARLPAIPPWRVGHYQRRLPEGYWESVDTDSNRIADPEIAALYDRVRLVTRGPLWGRERWRAIWELSLRR